MNRWMLRGVLALCLLLWLALGGFSLTATGLTGLSLWLILKPLLPYLALLIGVTALYVFAEFRQHHQPPHHNTVQRIITHRAVNESGEPQRHELPLFRIPDDSDLVKDLHPDPGHGFHKDLDALTDDVYRDCTPKAEVLLAHIEGFLNPHTFDIHDFQRELMPLHGCHGQLPSLLNQIKAMSRSPEILSRYLERTPRQEAPRAKLGRKLRRCSYSWSPTSHPLWGQMITNVRLATNLQLVLQDGLKVCENPGDAKELKTHLEALVLACHKGFLPPDCLAMSLEWMVVKTRTARDLRTVVKAIHAVTVASPPCVPERYFEGRFVDLIHSHANDLSPVHQAS